MSINFDCFENVEFDICRKIYVNSDEAVYVSLSKEFASKYSSDSYYTFMSKQLNQVNESYVSVNTDKDNMHVLLKKDGMKKSNLYNPLLFETIPSSILSINFLPFTLSYTMYNLFGNFNKGALKDIKKQLGDLAKILSDLANKERGHSGYRCEFRLNLYFTFW